MSGTVLTLDEINLLINSEEPKNETIYGNLYEELKNLEYSRAISIDQLPNLNKLGVGALTYNKESLMDAVKREWYTESVSETDPTKKVRCGLCNTPNKYLFYIRNRRNNKVLNVGSSCMKKFPGIDGYIEQKQNLRDIKLSHEISMRRYKFNQEFDNPLETIQSAEKYFKNLPVLLPYKLYMELKDTIQRMRNIYSAYVNTGKKPFDSTKTSFELFQLALNQFLHLKIQADKICTENIQNPLSCRRREIDWLLSNHKDYILMEIAHNNGIYTVNTIKRIYYYEFIKEKWGLIQQHNNAPLFKLYFPNENKGIIQAKFIKHGYSPNLSFAINYDTFMNNIGCYCLTNNDYMFNENTILESFTIVNSIRNIESVIYFVANMMNRTGCIFLVDYSSHVLYLYRKGDGAVKKIQTKHFLRSYSKHILKNDYDIEQFLISTVDSAYKLDWITKIDQEKQGIDDIINSLYKDQYVDKDIFINHYSTQLSYIEIPIYRYQNNQINYNKAAIRKVPKKLILLNNKKLDDIDYAVQTLNDDKKKQTLLIHITNELSDAGIAVFREKTHFRIRRFRKDDSGSILTKDDGRWIIRGKNTISGEVIGRIIED